MTKYRGVKLVDVPEPSEARRAAGYLFASDYSQLHPREYESTWCEEPKRVRQVDMYFREGRWIRLGSNSDGSPDLNSPFSVFWYDGAYESILERVGTPELANLFVLILAATSPQTNIPRNMEIAKHAYDYIVRKHATPAMIRRKFSFEAHSENLVRILQGEPLSGPKVASFARNLFGDGDAVTIDGWMIKSFRLPEELETAAGEEGGVGGAGLDRVLITEYRCMSDVVRKKAAEVNLMPMQYQAGTWTGIKMLRGDPEDDPIAPFAYFLDHHFPTAQTELAFNPDDLSDLDPGDGEFVFEYDPRSIGLE